MEFVKYIGGAAIAGKMVALYRDGDIFTLKAETVGGKRIKYQLRTAANEIEWRTIPDRRLNETELEEFMDRVNAGETNGQNARVVVNALIELGYPDEMFG